MSNWPRLDYVAERATYESMQLALQLIGKLPTRLLPWENHGWHVALRVTPRGLKAVKDTQRALVALWTNVPALREKRT